MILNDTFLNGCHKKIKKYYDEKIYVLNCQHNNLINNLMITLKIKLKYFKVIWKSFYVTY